MIRRGGIYMKKNNMIISGMFLLMILTIVILGNSLITQNRIHDETVDNFESELVEQQNALTTLDLKLSETKEQLTLQTDEKNLLTEAIQGKVLSLEKTYSLNELLSRQALNLEKHLQTQIKIISNLNISHDLLELYVMDINSYKKKKLYYLTPTDDKLEDANRIASVLTDLVFRGVAIEIVEEKMVNQENILYINLQELSEKNESGYYGSSSWFNFYFQGSTGGHFTYVTLINSFLQMDYVGPWYDGIYFSYEGGTQDFEHVEGLIGKIIYKE